MFGGNLCSIGTGIGCETIYMYVNVGVGIGIPAAFYNLNCTLLKITLYVHSLYNIRVGTGLSNVFCAGLNRGHTIVKSDQYRYA